MNTNEKRLCASTRDSMSGPEARIERSRLFGYWLVLETPHGPSMRWYRRYADAEASIYSRLPDAIVGTRPNRWFQ